MAQYNDKETCSICSGGFKQPKIFDCQHSFCQICLQNYVDRTSSDGHFQCPLCRCDVTLPQGDVNNLASKSTSDVPRCEVCTTGEAGFKCRDCDQHLCRSCRRIHDSLNSCKGHVIVGWDEPEPIGEEPDTKHVQDETDLCPCGLEKGVKYLCHDCNKRACWRCCIIEHNGHKHMDLQDEGVKQQIKDEIGLLADKIKHHINHLEEGLKTNNSESMGKVRELCHQIDVQVKKIFDEVTIIGENMKEHIKKIYQQNEENASSGTRHAMNFRKGYETAMETLKASMETSMIVLEETSIVQMVERLDQLRQEVEDCRSRRMEIPDVLVMMFEAGEIDRDILSKQVGRCNKQGMFEVCCSVDDISETGKLYDSDMWKWNDSREVVFDGATWCVRVYRDLYYDDVLIHLNLVKSSNERIKSCQIDYDLKLVNILDDNQSIFKHGIKRLKPGEWPDFITYSWSKLTDKQIGFIDDRNQFKVHVRIKVIESYYQ